MINQIVRINYIQNIFESNPTIFELEKYPTVLEIKREGKSKIKSILPLIDHPIYGETILYISEKLNDEGEISEYHYGWELSQGKKRLGKKLRHIMAFGNEDHKKGTNAWVETNPFHHHHIPEEPRKRKSTSVQDLDSVIMILRDFIQGKLKYNSEMNF
ncbi:toxin-antitoxin system TumE family protein [Cytobacillus horneckiae]|uniref:toxin-antitoxin system TumE family protein n=1 Tax=Cytobacillus horneckiae TaxID=549687 RepID=UPI003D9A45D9